MYTSCLILDREAFENNVPSGTHHRTDKLTLKRLFKCVLERTLGSTLVCTQRGVGCTQISILGGSIDKC